MPHKKEGSFARCGAVLNSNGNRLVWGDDFVEVNHQLPIFSIIEFKSGWRWYKHIGTVYAALILLEMR